MKINHSGTGKEKTTMVNFDRGMQIPAQVSQPDLSDENMLVHDYTDERNAKIAQLEQQIAMVKERIARNERALTGKSYEDANNRIAALEMKKINSQDPTMIWRWQQQRQDTKAANAITKSNAAAQFANTVDMWMNTRPAPTTEGIMQQISNINSAIRDGKNAGADVSRLETKKEELENLVYGNSNTESSNNYGAGTNKEQLAGELKTVLATSKKSDELIAYKNEHPELTPDQLSSVDTKIAELQKKEKANAEEREFEDWLEKKHGKSKNKLDPNTVKSYRYAWKKLRGK